MTELTINDIKQSIHKISQCDTMMGIKINYPYCSKCYNKLDNNICKNCGNNDWPIFLKEDERLVKIRNLKIKKIIHNDEKYSII